eukprot:365307-Chlamydomonas_euryale.AAC.5
MDRQRCDYNVCGQCGHQALCTSSTIPCAHDAELLCCHVGNVSKVRLASSNDTCSIGSLFDGWVTLTRSSCSGTWVCTCEFDRHRLVETLFETGRLALIDQIRNMQHHMSWPFLDLETRRQATRPSRLKLSALPSSRPRSYQHARHG